MVSRIIPVVPTGAVNAIDLGAVLRGLGWAVFATGAIAFGLFQKKLLSKPMSKFVSAVLFVPTFPITMLLRLGNLWTPVDDTVFLGIAPVGFLGHPEKLYKQGVRGVVNMCTEYSGPTSYYSSLGIKQLRLPTVDHFEPTVEYMQEACKKNGDKVYVHCKAGHGRAASIALCWMMTQHPGLPAKIEKKVTIDGTHCTVFITRQDVNELLSAKRKVRKTLYLQDNVKKFHALVQRSTPLTDKTQ